MTGKQFADLATLARDRCRESNLSVLQLMDNDQECAALLIAVATDIIYGSTAFLGDRPDTIKIAVKMLIDNICILGEPDVRREATR